MKYHIEKNHSRTRGENKAAGQFTAIQNADNTPDFKHMVRSGSNHNDTKRQNGNIKHKYHPQRSGNINQNETLNISDIAGLKEDKSRRTATEKFYECGGGRYKVVSGLKPMHYLNKSSSLYEEIDNTLSDNGEEIINTKNSFSTKFNKKLSNGKIFDMGKSDCGVSLFCKEVFDKQNSRGQCRCNMNFCGNSNALKIENKESDFDLEYLVESDRIKENIIIKKRTTDYRYEFALKTSNLAVEKAEDNESLLLKNKTTGQIEFIIPAPFMYDASGEYSDCVSLEIDNDESDDILTIIVAADKDFINAEDRVFPVTIDPIIFSSERPYDAFTYYIEYGSENISHTDPSFVVYEEESLYTDCRVSIINNFVQSEYEVQSLKLILTLDPSSTGFFSVDGVTYNSSNSPFEIDFTAIKNERDIEMQFLPESSKANIYLGANPFVLIAEIIPEEAEPVTQEFSIADKAVGQLEMSNGVYSTSFSDSSGDNFVLPLGISHSYKSNNENFDCGTNWRLNVHQSLESVPSENIENIENIIRPVFKFTDETGVAHSCLELYYYLKEQSGVSAKTREYIHKKDVIVSLDGKLSYDGKEVFKEQHFLSGLTIVPEVKDFKNAELVEQRQSEQKQLEEYVQNCKNTFKDYVGIDNSTGSYSDSNLLKNKFSGERLTKSSFDDFIKRYGSIVSIGDAVALQSYELQISSATGAQLNLLKAQKNLITDKSPLNIEAIKKLFKEYVNKEKELDKLLTHTPVNFLKDENNIVRGFNRDGKLVAVTDPYENYVLLEYDDKGKIRAIYDSESKQVSFQYDDKGLLSDIIDNSGRKTAYCYDSSGQLIKAVFADESFLEFTYESANIISVISSDQMKSTLTYENNKPTKITNFSLVSSISNDGVIEEVKEISSVNITYTGNEITLRDENDKRTRYTFDERRRLVCYVELNAIGSEEKTTYDYKYGEYRNITMENANAVNATIIENTILDKSNKPVSKETDYRKVSLGAKAKSKIDYFYDSENRLIKESNKISIKLNDGSIENNDEITEYFYNAKGVIVRMEKYSAQEQQTKGRDIEEHFYDEKGNVTKTVSWNSLDSSSKFYEESERSESGQVVSQYDESGENKTEYRYREGTNILTESISPNGGKAVFGRNPSTDIITALSSSDESGEESANNISYNCSQATEVRSGFNVINYEYDYKRRIKSVKLNDNNYARYSYTEKDSLGNSSVTTELLNDNNVTTAVTSLSDSYGNITSLSLNGVTQITNTYNDDNSLSSSSDLVTGATLSYGYNDVKQPAFVKRLKNETEQLKEEYLYNTLGLMSQKTISGAVNRTYSYNYKNNFNHDLNFTILPGGIKSERKSDSYGRTSESLLSSNDTPLLGEYYNYKKVGDHASGQISSVRFGNCINGKYVIEGQLKYLYDGNGNISGEVENGELVVRYAYDKLNRLIREDNKRSGKTHLYSYDNNGNILNKREAYYSINNAENLTEIANVSYLYNKGDRLIGLKTRRRNAIASGLGIGEYLGESGNIGENAEYSESTSIGFSYDNLGNPKVYRGKELVWINGRQLSKYDGLTFNYDGQGRRIKKGTTEYTYGVNGELLKESDTNDTIEYIYDNGRVVSFIHNDIQYLYRRNIQGDIISIYGIDSLEKACYNYDSFGNVRVLNPDKTENLDTNFIGNINPIRYRGYYYDGETGLYYLQSRYYDPEIGRFINADDISYLDPESIGGLNLYSYCGSNPVNRVDPTGHAWWEFWKWDWQTIGIGIGMVVTAVAAVALAVVTFGAGTPLAMGIIAGVTLAAGILTGINGIATIGEGISGGYNFMRDGLFNEVLGLSDNAYNIYSGVVEGIAVVGSMILGVYNTTGRAQASRAGRQYLGKGYSKEGPGRWVSQDGFRQMRIDNHNPFGKHFNLETWKYSIALGIRNKKISNIHQLYKWFRTWIG